MGVISERVTVAAPAARVWAAVIDFEARPKWEPRVREATIVGGGPLKEGSQIRLRVDRDRFTSTVVEMQPASLLSLLVKGPGFRVNHIYRLQPEGNLTALEMTGDYRGVIGSLVTRLMQRSVRRDLTDELNAIKRAAEKAG